MNLLIPNKCPSCRHEERISRRNPRELHARNCFQCDTKLITSYAKERLEKVVCEKCFHSLID